MARTQSRPALRMGVGIHDRSDRGISHLPMAGARPSERSEGGTAEELYQERDCPLRPELRVMTWGGRERWWHGPDPSRQAVSRGHERGAAQPADHGRRIRHVDVGLVPRVRWTLDRTADRPDHGLPPKSRDERAEHPGLAHERKGEVTALVSLPDDGESRGLPRRFGAEVRLSHGVVVGNSLVGSGGV